MKKIQKKNQRKNINQNLRNKILNQNYKFNLKFIGKKIFKQIKTFFHFNKFIKAKTIFIKILKQNLNLLIISNFKNIFSLLDKSYKKNIYKKNNILRKKSKLFRIKNLLLN